MADRARLLSEAEEMVGAGSFRWEPGRPPLWSNGFFRQLGFAPGEIEPSEEAFFARVHPDDLERLRREQAATIEGAIQGSEFRIVRADTGEVRVLASRTRADRKTDRDGAPVFIGTVLDITDMKRSALRDEQALVTMRVAERVAKMGSFMVELDPMRTEWTDGLYEMAGLEDREASLEARRQMIHPDDQERHAAWFASVMEGKDMPPIQSRFVRPDGEVRHGMTHAALVNFESDGKRRVVGTSVDVTERVALEEQLRHVAKMEAVGTLAAGVAHDFNNYLMVIQSCLDMLREEPEETALIESLRTNAEHAAARCMELTQQLLAFARRRPAAGTTVNLGEAVGRIAALLEPTLGPDLDFSVTSPDRPLRVRVDTAHLEQVLANLMINSRDAIRDSGRHAGAVKVAVDEVTLEKPARGAPAEVPAGHWARIRVQDNGCGIDAEILPRIFEPYFSTKGFSRGTGLGLAAVYGVVQQNQGHVTVETWPGEATRFTVWLPVAEEAERGASPRRVPKEVAADGGCRLLVVDDVPEVRQVVALALRGAGFEVIEAGDGQEALARFEQGTFDLVLTDVRMPRMGGAQLARLLKARCPELPILLMTGFSEPVDVGDLPVLHKPIRAGTLVAKVREMLGEAGAVREWPD